MKSACFTGHRKISHNIEELESKLYCILEKMIKKTGLLTFLTAEQSGGIFLRQRLY